MVLIISLKACQMPSKAATRVPVCRYLELLGRLGFDTEISLGGEGGGMLTTSPLWRFTVAVTLVFVHIGFWTFPSEGRPTCSGPTAKQSRRAERLEEAFAWADHSITALAAWRKEELNKTGKSITALVAWRKEERNSDRPQHHSTGGLKKRGERRGTVTDHSITSLVAWRKEERDSDRPQHHITGGLKKRGERRGTVTDHSITALVAWRKEERNSDRPQHHSTGGLKERGERRGTVTDHSITALVAWRKEERDSDRPQHHSTGGLKERGEDQWQTTASQHWWLEGKRSGTVTDHSITALVAWRKEERNSDRPQHHSTGGLKERGAGQWQTTASQHWWLEGKRRGTVTDHSITALVAWRKEERNKTVADDPLLVVRDDLSSVRSVLVISTGQLWGDCLETVRSTCEPFGVLQCCLVQKLEL